MLVYLTKYAYFCILENGPQILMTLLTCIFQVLYKMIDIVLNDNLSP